MHGVGDGGGSGERAPLGKLLELTLKATRRVSERSVSERSVSERP
jgi:hypothetical protein